MGVGVGDEGEAGFEASSQVSLLDKWLCWSKGGKEVSVSAHVRQWEKVQKKEAGLGLLSSSSIFTEKPSKS